MRHYLAVLVPDGDRGWRVHLPDFPGCRAEAPTVEAAINASGSAAAGQARQLTAQGVPLTQTTDLRGGPLRQQRLGGGAQCRLVQGCHQFGKAAG
jgi:hypothetical protein